MNWLIAFSGLAIAMLLKFRQDKTFNKYDLYTIIASAFSVFALMLVFINPDTVSILTKWFGFKELHPDTTGFILRLASLVVGLMNLGIVMFIRRRAKKKMEENK